MTISSSAVCPRCLIIPGLSPSPICPWTFARAKGADGAGGPASYPAAGGYRLDVDPGARRKQRLTGAALNHKHGHYFVINQSDSRRQVSRDVTSLMEEKLGERLLGVIHRDESVVEANASQKSILDFNASSAAAFDIEIMAKNIFAVGYSYWRWHGAQPATHVRALTFAGLLNEKISFGCWRWCCHPSPCWW